MAGRVSAVVLLLCCALPACRPTRHHVRYVPVEEAAWFKFGADLPEEGRVELSGAEAAAMHVASEHFLPWGAPAPDGADREELCAHQRQSWDVETAPGEGGLTYVRFTLSPGACFRWGPPMDMEATYAVDVPNARPRDNDPLQPPPELPRQGRRRIEGNMAAAIQLAMEDFLPGGAPTPAEVRPEERCLYQRDAYGVVAAPAPMGVVQIRFTVDAKRCPTEALGGGSGVLAIMDRTVYAVDIRTMRILSIGNHAHLRPLAPPPPVSPASTSGTSSSP